MIKCYTNLSNEDLESLRRRQDIISKEIDSYIEKYMAENQLKEAEDLKKKDIPESTIINNADNNRDTVILTDNKDSITYSLNRDSNHILDIHFKGNTASFDVYGDDLLNYLIDATIKAIIEPEGVVTIGHVELLNHLKLSLKTLKRIVDDKPVQIRE